MGKRIRKVAKQRVRRYLQTRDPNDRYDYFHLFRKNNAFLRMLGRFI